MKEIEDMERELMFSNGKDREFLAKFALNLTKVFGGSYTEDSEICWARIGELIGCTSKDEQLKAAKMAFEEFKTK